MREGTILTQVLEPAYAVHRAAGVGVRSPACAPGQDKMYAVLAALFIPVTCSDLSGKWQPVAG